MGIEVHVPDVNRSVSDFAPITEVGADGSEVRSIVFGLSAVRNVGEGLVRLLLAERDANGPFVDFYDFCERVDFQVLNKKTLESRSEEHTSELQSLMRISYAVFCLKKKKKL